MFTNLSANSEFFLDSGHAELGRRHCCKEVFRAVMVRLGGGWWGVVGREEKNISITFKTVLNTLAPNTWKSKPEEITMVVASNWH